MATAIQLGLVPGFALQNGDLIAALLSGEGGAAAPGAMFGLGSTTNPTQAASGNASFANAAQLQSSVTVMSSVTATNNSVRLADIPPGTCMRIYNPTANLLNVFPPTTSQSIDGNPNGNAVFLSADARCDYMYIGNNVWISDLLGTSSE